MKKRFLALLMVLAMTLLASGGAAEVAVSEPGVLPIVTEPVTLRVLVTEAPALIDWNTNAFILWMEEQTGVHLEFDYVPINGREEKLNLILATGNYPDVFLGMGAGSSASFSDAVFQQYGVQEGMLLPLNDLIERHAVETKKIFEQFPGSKNKLTWPNGNIYSMPNVNECYHCTMAGAKFSINKAWLDTLGLAMPTTTDEFYDVLVAFRDKDPNGNGLKDELPLAGAYVNGWETNSDAFILNAYTYYDLSLSAETTGTSVRAFGLYLDDNGKVVVPFDDPALREGLKFIRKLYDEGLFYAGSFTQDLAQLTQLAENASANLVGAVSGGAHSNFTLAGGERYREYEYLMPLSGPNGYRNAVLWPHDSVGYRNFVISATCENPAVAVKWADFCLTLEASLRAYYGEKDVDWKWAEEGQVGINGEPAIYEQLTPWQGTDPQNAHIVQYGLDKRDAAFRLGIASPADLDKYSAEGVEMYLYQATKEYEPYGNPNRTLPPLKFDADTASALMVSRTELSNAIKEGMIGFMTGARDVDADYDTFLADLEAKGLRTLIDAYQQAYDAQYK